MCGRRTSGETHVLYVALAIFLVTLLLIFWRPFGVSEAWFALGGAIVSLACGIVGWHDILILGRETGGVLLFLLGILVVAALTDRAGVFARLALWTGNAAGGKGRLLFVAIYGIGVLVTMWLSLDTTAVILAPVVYSLVRALRLPPLPFVFATTYVANTASLFLPVSNLTNLIVFGRLDIPFWEYAQAMLLPGVLAVAANLLLLLWLYRTSIPKRYALGEGALIEYGVATESNSAAQLSTSDADASVQSGSADEPWDERLPEAGGRLTFVVTTWALLAVLFALAVAPFWEIELWIVACVGGALLAFYHVGWARLGARELARSVSWDLLPFVFSLFLILRGVANAGLSEWAAGLVATWASGQSFWELFAVASAAALGSNLVNNLPMILIAVESLAAPVSTGELGLASLYAALIGTNIGPNLTVIGSLATMLSLSIIGKKGLRVSGLMYLKVGLICVPVTLTFAVLGLWLSI